MSSWVSKLALLAVAAVAVALGSVQEAQAQEKYRLNYRLTEPKSTELADILVARKYYQALQGLGCQARLEGRHITYACPDWTTAEVSEAQSAKHIDNFLRNLGFETELGE